MTIRDRIYLELMQTGLVIMKSRGAIYPEICAIEAEHLHNLPSLIEETNKYRHEYYFHKERNYYLKRLLVCDNNGPWIFFVYNQYLKAWNHLKTFGSYTDELEHYLIKMKSIHDEEMARFIAEQENGHSS